MPYARKTIIPTALVLLASLLTGCEKIQWHNPFDIADAPAVTLGVQGEMVALTDRTALANDSTIYDSNSRGVKLFAGANEVVSLQLMVEPGTGGAKNLRFSASDLASPGGAKIAAANVAAFRMMPVKVTQYPPWYLRLVNVVPEPVSFYDALVPLAATQPGALALAEGERLALWVDLSVPRGTAAGEYTGQLRVAADTRQDATLGVTIKVYNFVLPDERPLAAVGAFDYTTLFGKFIQRDGKPFVPEAMDRNNPLVMKGLVLMRQLMVLAHEHRLDLFDRQIHPVIKRDMSGKITLDWEDYDAVVLPYLSGTAFADRIGCGAWPMPYSDAWPDVRNYRGGIDSDDYAADAALVSAQCQQHLGKNLDFGRQLFVWPYRGPVEQDAYARDVRLARLVRIGDQDSPILSQLPPNPPQLAGWTVTDEFRRLTDIVAPPAQWLEASKAASLARSDRRLAGAWLSPGTPPYLPSMGVIATPADVRSIPWFAMKYGCTGLFLPEVLNWRGDVFSTAAGAETRLFYPGNMVGVDAVLPSVRLKRLRRGLQDLAYLTLLRQRERAALATTIANALVRYGGLEAAGDNYLDPRLDGWVRDPQAYEAARRLMAEEIQALIHPSDLTNHDLLAQRLTWQQFEQQTHTVRVEQIRSRVTPAPGANLLRATVTLELFNEHGRNVDVLVKLDKLPEGWKGVADQIHLAPMAPNERKTVVLSAEGTYVPMGAAGKMALPLSLTVDMQNRRQLAVAVPFLTASGASAPKIDGRLDDWPMRAGNTAGDFRLIGARGQSDHPLARRGTLVFVTRDRDNLYLAFRCEEPQLDKIAAQSSNIIHYEQLMACDEDLVEVILDPGCTAKGPEDLYHITVKPNGVLLTEHGVHTDPPLGKASAWPVAASVAVGKGDKTWVVEMAIPLSAFGPAGKENFWGVNFTRFATQGSEASSWSEAGRYFYDPRNLGTMYLAAEQK